MIINVKTVIMGLAIGYLVFGSMLSLFQRDEPPDHKIPFWAVGKILQGLGMLLLLGRGTTCHGENARFCARNVERQIYKVPVRE